MNPRHRQRTKKQKTKSGKKYVLLPSDVYLDKGCMNPKINSKRVEDHEVREKARLHMMDVLNAYKTNYSLLNFGMCPKLKYRLPKRNIIALGQPKVKRNNKRTVCESKLISDSSKSLLHEGYLLKATKKYINLLTRDDALIPQHFAPHRHFHNQGEGFIKSREEFYDVGSTNSSQFSRKHLLL